MSIDYPPTIIDKAQRLERLLQRVEAGESFESVRTELGLNVRTKDLPRLQARYEASGRRWEALLDGRHGHNKTIKSTMREWLYERKRQDDTLRAPDLAAALERQFGVKVAAGHINYLLRKVGLTGPPGRRFKSQVATPPTDPPTAPEPTVANAGLFFPGGGQAGDGLRRDG